MIYHQFGKMKWLVSAIGQGLGNIGNRWGEMTDEEAVKIINEAYDNGINLFDIADVYGSPQGLSEMRLSKALKGKRDKVLIASKVGTWGSRYGHGIPLTTPDTVRLMVHACAGRLKTDYIDIILCHDGNPTEPEIYIEGFEKLKTEGFIREYGISTDNFEVLKKFYELSGGGCIAVELGYSLLFRSAEEKLLPFCMENNIAVLIKRPLERGLLSGKFDEKTVFSDEAREKWNPGGKSHEKYLKNLKSVEKLKSIYPERDKMAEAAIRFLISHPAKPVAVPGATKPEQVAKNAEAASRLFGKEEIAEIRKYFNEKKDHR